MNIKTEITKLHYNKNAAGLLFFVLRFFSLFYGAGSRLKNFLYDKNILKSKKTNAYVISVGNLTTGGVGKTPVVAEIAKYFITKGEKVAIISRGYGGSLSNKNVNIISDGNKIYHDAQLAGDEPYWHAVNTKAIVITSKNRIKAAEVAVNKFGVSKIILDDGFQHRKLYRDLDIILCDSEKWFGNGHLLPAGPLREGMDNLSRANRLVIVSKNTNHSSAEQLTVETEKKLNIKTILCKTEPNYVYNIKSGEILPDGEKITAICAIGQPEQFYKFLNNYDVTETKTFEDHHQYTKEDLYKISGKIVTTEKDAVKLERLGFDNIYALKLKTSINIEELFS